VRFVYHCDTFAKSSTTMELFKEKKDYTEKASKKKMAGNFEFRARIVVDIYIYIYIYN
jgi:hypothetical protein